ncbi:mycothiol transferase [Phytomonospora endophytica]|uniref:Mini-circle protein n=1 Tax=Phytomonospora endophytica TaxID=714109 RepID=A0A841FF89_9ACTN|nr:DUF664 domain-containing protein [Phytomonospora endophytica]MBB6032232.1 hypothetical protein [Phytomonospora endophytica]
MSDDTEVIPNEPPLAGTEAEALVGALERSRAIFRWKTHGLDAEGLSASVGVSTMTLGGLVKHVAAVEDTHFARLLLAAEPPEPWASVDWDADPDWDWRSAADDTPAQLEEQWRESSARSRAIVAEALADGGPGGLGRYKTGTGESPNLRRIVLDMIEEYARHIGHADLIRETVDGLVGEGPPR